MTEPKFSVKAIRECAAAYVRDMEKHKETPSALIRWTIPGLCDEVERLRERIGVLERLKGDAEVMADRNAEDATLWRAHYNRTYAAKDRIWVNADGTTTPILPATADLSAVVETEEWCAAHNAIWPLAESRCAAADPWKDVSPCERRATLTDGEVQ